MDGYQEMKEPWKEGYHGRTDEQKNRRGEGRRGGKEEGQKGQREEEKKGGRGEGRKGMLSKRNSKQIMKEGKEVTNLCGHWYRY